MKKNKMMRIASVLLVAVLVSTCAISGTFAKYVSSGSAQDSARVAKWGVRFDITSDLFADSYEYHDTTGGYKADYSVKSSDKVVAPGTSGDAYTFTTTGTPEVSYIVSFAKTPDSTWTTIYTSDNGLGDTTKTEDYYPVKFTIKLGEYTNAGFTSMDDLAAALAYYKYYYSVDKNAYYVSNDGGATWVKNGNKIPTMNISWEWDFSTSALDDTYDTFLGDYIAGVLDGYTVTGVNVCTDINIDITATATQID